jgi:hypothetical protein
MKTPVKREPRQRERNNRDIEPGGLDEGGDQQRPRTENRRRRRPAAKSSSRREHGRL